MVSVVNFFVRTKKQQLVNALLCSIDEMFDFDMVFHWWNVRFNVDFKGCQVRPECCSPMILSVVFPSMKSCNPTLFDTGETFETDIVFHWSNVPSRQWKEFDNLQNRWSIKTKPIADVSHALTICFRITFLYFGGKS